MESLILHSFVCKKIDYKQDPEQFRERPIYKGNEEVSTSLYSLMWLGEKKSWIK